MMAEALDGRGRRGAPCRCGRAYDESEWAELELLDRIEGQRLLALVTVWPCERAIEVRRCAGCRAPLARTCDPVSARRTS
jgi:hypothetical protein